MGSIKVLFWVVHVKNILLFQQEHFWSLDKTEFRIPPKLTVQIWDNDKFSLDDYLGIRWYSLLKIWKIYVSILWKQLIVVLGTVELDLHKLVAPSKSPEKCSLQLLEKQETGGPHKLDNVKSLFAQQAVRGWWPCAIEQDGKKVLGVSIYLKNAPAIFARLGEAAGQFKGLNCETEKTNPTHPSNPKKKVSVLWTSFICLELKFSIPLDTTIDSSTHYYKKPCNQLKFY